MKVYSSPEPLLGRSFAIAPLVLIALAVHGCRDSTAPSANDLTLTAPVVGTPMVDVFYGAYVDHLNGTAVRDYACGTKTYDGHRGVDILLRNFREQDAGVAVIAAEAGVVSSVSDGQADRNTSWGQATGLGNHVVVSHANGWTTTYGHLRRGSVTVAPGARVERGTQLGLVGSSGRSNWPHLHFEVRVNGSVVEPFAGECAGTTSLWAEQLPYQDAYMVTDAGIMEQQPTLALMLERPPTLTEISLDAERFRFWLQVVNQRPGVLRYELIAPDGVPLPENLLGVGGTFSMSYVIMTVPVRGYFTQAGNWQIRVYHGTELLRAQPFTLVPGVVADAHAMTDRPPGSDVSFEVLDQGTGARERQ